MEYKLGDGFLLSVTNTYSELSKVEFSTFQLVHIIDNEVLPFVINSKTFEIDVANRIKNDDTLLISTAYELLNNKNEGREYLNPIFRIEK